MYENRGKGWWPCDPPKTDTAKLRHKPYGIKKITPTQRRDRVYLEILRATDITIPYAYGGDGLKFSY